jgi:aminopeptidase
MEKSTLGKYARLIAAKGVNIRPGQECVIVSELDQPEFVDMLAEECYKLGAAKVTVDWTRQSLTKLHAQYQALETLGRVEDWEEQRLCHRRDTLPAMIYLESADPDGLAGMDQDKWAKAIQMRYKVIKPIRDAMENKYQWCIAAVPGRAWAKKMFPDLPEDEAVEKLWEAILYTSRAQGDPVANWEAHNADLRQRCEYLNALRLRKLVYKAGNGTDLTVGLIPQAVFAGGEERAVGSGIVFNPNIPSEEVFTSPMKGQAEGIVYSTRPLSYRGVMIEDFSIRFENGRVAEVHAKKNEDVLKTMTEMDEGAAMLGECALVPYDSPIRNSGLMFYSTLFDENAACHLALGTGFADCIRGYENMTLEECRALGVNESMIHEDFMIGSADLDITGVDADGREIPIFRNGGWAF